MIDILTSLRFFAILLIYFNHLAYPGGLGPVAATFFFVLSGFVIAYGSSGRFLSLDLHELKGFYIKRLNKVYPLHVLTFFLSLPIVYVTDFETNLLSALLNIFLQSYFPIGIQVFCFNALSWFLSDMVFFYFLIPFLLFRLQKIRAREIDLFCCSCSCCLFSCVKHPLLIWLIARWHRIQLVGGFSISLPG